MIRLAPFAAAIALATAALAPSPGHAAHAGAPYTNVDRRNDAGNDTGDSQVDRLNAQQLDQNYRGPVTMVPSAVQPIPPGAVVVVPRSR